MNTLILSQKEKTALSEWRGKLTLGIEGGYFLLLPKETLEVFRLLANRFNKSEFYRTGMCCKEAEDAVFDCYNYADVYHWCASCGEYSETKIKQELQLCKDCLQEKKDCDNF